jgi:hypothetical protein
MAELIEYVESEERQEEGFVAIPVEPECGGTEDQIVVEPVVDENDNDDAEYEQRQPRTVVEGSSANPFFRDLSIIKDFFLTAFSDGRDVSSLHSRTCQNDVH